MKTYVLMLAQVFPADHPKAGIPTGFQEIYSKGYLYAVYIYSHRINCYKNNQNLGHSSPVNYAWFRFIKGITSRVPRIYWIQK